MSRNFRLEEYKNASKRIEKIMDNIKDYAIIHYSCESFYNDLKGRTPRISSIAIKMMGTGQTYTFSIHKYAEIEHVNADSIDDQKYERFEKTLLDEYFRFVKRNQGITWLHWNMTNITFGFAALEHRYRVLGGNPTIIADDKKLNISWLLASRYGDMYAPHRKFENLTQMNNWRTDEFMTGKEEADAFDHHQYVSLHRSTLRKVEVISKIINAIAKNTLKVDTKTWKDIYGISPNGIFQYTKENWILSVSFFIVGNLLMALIIKVILGQ